MVRKKQNIPEPNLLTQRFAAGPPTPNQREGGKKNAGKFFFILIILLAVGGLAAIQFIPVNEEGPKHWTDAVTVLNALDKNPIDKRAIAAMERIAEAIDDLEIHREARTGLLTVTALGKIRASMPGASFSECESIAKRYPETSFAKMLTKEKLCKNLSKKDKKCSACNGKGTRSQKSSLMSASKASKKLGSVERKCLTCGGTGKKKNLQTLMLDKDKVRTQYDEARSRTTKLAIAQKALENSSSLISKLQFLKK